jgi:hypothetical protein
MPQNKMYRSKVVHIYDVERGWSGPNEHYTNRIQIIAMKIFKKRKIQNILFVCYTKPSPTIKKRKKHVVYFGLLT